MRVLLDANAILRYLLDDDAEMAARTRSALSYGAFLLPEVLAEVVYVLSGVYAVPRKELAEKTIPFLSEIQSAQHDVLVQSFSLLYPVYPSVIRYPMHSSEPHATLSLTTQVS